ncbi:hypothetical protein Nepgr_027182 [Nepenthes gracilis]|uniref:Secreted protein n=1 Tax=Nepenthes gracilis TaxID=150966 RepID=A0AAD3TAD3_NEPGR|nr:hypothetical protein Nepgr_027182 [Nepenthes gracilis]
MRFWRVLHLSCRVVRWWILVVRASGEDLLGHGSFLGDLHVAVKLADHLLKFFRGLQVLGDPGAWSLMMDGTPKVDADHVGSLERLLVGLLIPLE